MAVTRKVEKYNPRQPRDNAGRWTSGGGTFSGTSDKAREVAARIGPTTNRDTFTGMTAGDYGLDPVTVTRAEATYTAPDGTEWPMEMEVQHFNPGAAAEENVLARERFKTEVRVGDYRPSETVFDPEVHSMPQTVYPEDQSRRAKSGWNAYMRTGGYVSTTRGPVQTVEWIEVGRDLRRQGLGTAMLEFARRESITPINHSDTLTSADNGGGEPFAEVVKYNPSQPRDSRGRWTDGASAGGFLPGLDPKSLPSVSPREALDSVLSAKRGDSDYAKKADLFEAVLNSRIGKPFGREGLQAKVEAVYPGRRGMPLAQVSGTIYTPEGEMVGRFERTFYRDSVVHALLEIDSTEHQGTGFGTEFSAASEAMYTEMGMNSIRLQTGLSKGGYTWALAGYEFDWEASNALGDVPYQIQEAFERRWNGGQGGESGKADAKFIADTFRFDAEGDTDDTWDTITNEAYYSSPWQIANLRTPSGVHIGREIMEGAEWYGVKYLTESTFGKALTNREYVRLFDDFTRSRRLDLDDQYWSEEDRAEWQAILASADVRKYNPRQPRDKNGRWTDGAGSASVATVLNTGASALRQSQQEQSEAAAKYQPILDAAVGRALSNIAKAHPTAELDGLTVKGVDSLYLQVIRMPPHAMGFYRPGEDFVTINLDAADGDVAVLAETLTHEIGHYLDATSFKAAEAFEENQIWIGSRANALGTMWKESAAALDVKPEDSDYLSIPAEVVARVYSQWVAERAGDSAVLGTLKDDSGHWLGEDFAPFRDLMNEITGTVEKRYNSDQPRDDFGRWTSGGFGNTRLAGVGDVSMAGQARAARARGNFYRIDGAEFTPEQIEAATTEGASLGQIDVAYQGGTAALLRGAEQAWQGTDKWNSHILKRTEETETVEGFKRVVEEELDAYFKGAETRIRVPKDKLSAIIADGHLKSTFENKARLEVSTSAFMSPDNYHGFRAILESEFYGIPLGTGNAERHPIYGALEPKGMDFAGRLEGYGDVTLTLKPRATGRTTFTFGDSFTSELTVPTLVDSPGYQSVDPYRLMEAAMGNGAEVLDRDAIRGAINSILDTEYIEAQVHGGVTLDDIATVGFTYPYPRGIEEANAAGLTVVSQGKTYAPVDKRFNSDQPRDERGRWTDGVGGGSATVQVSPSLMLGGNRFVSPERAAERTAEYKARLEGVINRSLGNISKVHAIDTGEIKIIGKDNAAMIDAKSSALGFYSLDSDSITLNLDSGTEAEITETLTHEMGHLLDWRGVTPVTGPNAPVGRRQEIARLWSYSEANISGGFSQRDSAYLGAPQEVFARGYSQYVAEEAGDFDVQLVHQNDATHWQGDDFEPIRNFVVNALGDKVTKRYNSDQPRDARGRWTDGGGGLTGVAGAERLDRAAFLSNLPGEDFHGNRAIARNISADKSISTLDALIVAEAGREPHADIAARHEIAMDKARSIGAASIAHSGPMTFRRSWGASILPEFPTAETPADQIAKTPDEIDAAIRNVVIEDATRALSQAWNTRANGHLALFVQDAIAKKRPGAATLEDIYGEGSARYIRQGTEFMDSPSMRRFADSYAQGVYDNTQAQLRELGVSSVAVARGMKIEPDMPQPPLGESVNVRLRPMSSFSTDVQKAFHFAATQGGGTANGYIQKMDVKAEDIWSVGGLGPGALEEREIIVLDNGSNTSLVEGGYVMEKAASPAVVEAVGNLWPVDPIDAWLGEQIEKRFNSDQPRDSKGRWTDGGGGTGKWSDIAASAMGREERTAVLRSADPLYVADRAQASARSMYKDEIGFRYMNRHLRKPGESMPGSWDSPAVVALREKRAAEAVPHLEALIRSNAIDRDATVFRGLTSTLNVAPGDTVTDAGFMSTSVDPGVASGFGATGDDTVSGTIFRIRVPAGTPALSFPTEGELLLPPGTTLRITGVQKVEYGVEVADAEVV